LALSKFQRVSLFIVAVIATVGVAYILGVAAAGVVQTYRTKKYKAEKTAEILKQMGSGLAEGVTLPDADLQDLTGNPIKLSQAVGSRSMVSFISPDCGACKIAMDRIKEIVPAQEQANFILISVSNLTELNSLRDSLDLHCTILYDPDAEYQLGLGVFTFPFNLVVDQSLVIKDIIAGAPEEGEIETLAKFHRGR
jgi:peroxiredoxin